MQFLMELTKMPFVLIVVMILGLVFVGMTYEFILRLFKRTTPVDDLPAEDNGRAEPPEPANVPKPPTGPNDVLEGTAELEGAEEVEGEDGTKTYEYIYKSDAEPWDWERQGESHSQSQCNVTGSKEGN